jgi:hypothetical protein
MHRTPSLVVVDGLVTTDDALHSKRDLLSEVFSQRAAVTHGA